MLQIINISYEHGLGHKLVILFSCFNLGIAKLQINEYCCHVNITSIVILQIIRTCNYDQSMLLTMIGHEIG